MLKNFRMFFEVAMSQAEAPATASRQRVLLAIEGNDPWSYLGGNGGGASAPRPIHNIFSGLKTSLPDGDGSYMTSQDGADYVCGKLMLQQMLDFQAL
jgi:hypothetical protein